MIDSLVVAGIVSDLSEQIERLTAERDRVALKIYAYHQQRFAQANGEIDAWYDVFACTGDGWRIVEEALHPDNITPVEHL